MDFLEEIRNRGGGGLVSINDPANQRKRSSAQRPLPPAEQDNDLLNVLAMGFDKIKKQKNMSSDESESDSDDDGSTDNWTDEDC